MTSSTPRVRAALVALSLAWAGAACADLVTDIPPYGAIEVTAERRSGDPVAGVELEVYTGARPMAIGTTDAAGRHVFDFLPMGRYGVYAKPPDGYERPEVLVGGPSTAYFDEGLALDEGQHVSAHFTYLKVGPGTIDVTVAEATGAPIEGAAVDLYDPSGVIRSDTSDAQGGVRFEGVPFGAWGVIALPPRGYLDTGEGAKWVDAIPIEEGAEEAVRIAFPRCVGTVRVTVRGPAGAAVPDFPLVLYDAAAVQAEMATGPNGVGVFPEVPCGDYGIALGSLPPWLAPEGRGTSFVDGIHLHRGGEFSTTFTVTRCVGGLRVRVVDTGGRPIAGAGLILYTAQGIVTQGSTDATGTRIFSDLACVTGYGVRVVPPSGYLVQEGRGQSFFDGIQITDGGEAMVTFRLVAS